MTTNRKTKEANLIRWMSVLYKIWKSEWNYEKGERERERWDETRKRREWRVKVGWGGHHSFKRWVVVLFLFSQPNPTMHDVILPNSITLLTHSVSEDGLGLCALRTPTRFRRTNSTFYKTRTKINYSHKTLLQFSHKNTIFYFFVKNIRA